MNNLRIYWKDSVLYSNLTNYFAIGYIDNTGALFDITISPTNFLKITILEPTNTSPPKDVIINNIEYKAITVTPSDTNITLAIKLEYIPTGISQVLSFTLVPQINLLSQNDIQLLISRVLPPNVYNVGVNSTVYPRLYGIANTLISLYQPTTDNEVKNISNFINDIYPINGNPNWEIALDGTQSLLYQSTQQDYGELLQHLYATTINNDNNPYYYTYNISKFIYLLLGQQYFVALNENKANINNAFIIANNSLGNVILSPTNNELVLNVFIFAVNLSFTVPTAWQQTIINKYIRRITRCAVNPLISYGLIPELSTFLNDTYWGDVRQDGTYCISYNPGKLEQAKGYLLPIISVNEVLGVTFQIFIAGNIPQWTEFNTSTPIAVTRGQTYRLRLSIDPGNSIPEISTYGQFHIGNSGNLSYISVTYNPNPTILPTNDNYFNIVFKPPGNIPVNISINAYGLWFNRTANFTVT